MQFMKFSVVQPLKTVFSKRMRKYRMNTFICRMGICGGERILDLGGAPQFWDDCPVPLNITIMNLPGYNSLIPPVSRHTITILEGDACHVKLPADNSFDIVFSNSVIEHVGDRLKRADMAKEVRRLAPLYWVQTPSIWFPVEAHCYMLFWWFYPEFVRRFFLRRWHNRLPAWTEMMMETTVVLKNELESLFPDAEIWTERKFGFTKSYVFYRRKAASELCKQEVLTVLNEGKVTNKA